jgi:hypothetical protein
MMLEPVHTESMFGTGIEKSPAASNGIVTLCIGIFSIMFPVSEIDEWKIDRKRPDECL